MNVYWNVTATQTVTFLLEFFAFRALLILLKMVTTQITQPIEMPPLLQMILYLEITQLTSQVA